ncbi:MAG: putative rRNA maturation factor [Elusimicrobia bacterium]|nr:MAG: putative rRNA maturation factor [Elusimicrobiota bacterium]
MKITVVGAGPLGAAGSLLVGKAAKAALGAKAMAPGELCVVFASDAQVHSLNKRFLSHDRETDVISFNYPRPKEAAPDSPFGDVYISLGVAKRQAKALGHSLEKEAVTLAVHGTLHLVGYDDAKPADKARMFKRQDALVAALLPPRGKTKKK